jgi:hypothetical protein
MARTLFKQYILYDGVTTLGIGYAHPSIVLFRIEAQMNATDAHITNVPYVPYLAY